MKESIYLMFIFVLSKCHLIVFTCFFTSGDFLNIVRDWHCTHLLRHHPRGENNNNRPSPLNHSILFYQVWFWKTHVFYLSGICKMPQTGLWEFEHTCGVVFSFISYRVLHGSSARYQNTPGRWSVWRERCWVWSKSRLSSFWCVRLFIQLYVIQLRNIYFSSLYKLVINR